MDGGALFATAQKSVSKTSPGAFQVDKIHGAPEPLIKAPRSLLDGHVTLSYSSGPQVQRPTCRCLPVGMGTERPVS